MKVRHVTSALGIAVSALVAAEPADAHPHVWIDAHVGFVMAGTKITGLNLTWRFDELFSSYIVDGFDTNKDNRFDASENRALEAEAFAAVKEFGYFTHLRVGDDLQPFKTHQDFQATVEDGIIVYRFALTVESAPDAASERVAVALYDDSYYFDVALQEIDPVALDASTGCSFDVAEDAAHPIYYGMVFPIAVAVRCATS